MIDIYNKDVFETMSFIPDNSVNLILTDMPYGTTKNEWDIMPDLKQLWYEFERIMDIDGVIVCTAIQPFTSMLVMNNLKMFKYSWVWEKANPSGFLNCKKMPLKDVEDILVFYDHQPTYNPQGLIRIDKKRTNDKSKTGENGTGISSHDGGKMKGDYIQEYTNYPRQVLKFKTENGYHPTQKPVDLMAYLIKTYTNENELVFDGFMGSGTTGIACVKTNRNFVGCEIDKKYFNTSSERINKALEEKRKEKDLTQKTLFGDGI
jgi:site-specific DNA-methyltransferase (adenine-specific)